MGPRGGSAASGSRARCGPSLPHLRGLPRGRTHATFALERCLAPPLPPGPSQVCPRERSTLAPAATPPPSRSPWKRARRTALPYQAQLLSLLCSGGSFATPTAASRALLPGGHVTRCPYCTPREDLSPLLRARTRAVRLQGLPWHTPQASSSGGLLPMPGRCRSERPGQLGAGRLRQASLTPELSWALRWALALLRLLPSAALITRSGGHVLQPSAIEPPPPRSATVGIGVRSDLRRPAAGAWAGLVTA